MKITKRMVDDGTVTRVDVFRYITEASTLGLAPGNWPLVIHTDIGNSGAFLRGRVNDGGAHYQQAGSTRALFIFND